MNKLGIDIGSTTIKYVLLDDKFNILFKSYERHNCRIFEKCAEILEKVLPFCTEENLQICITGSAGMGVCEKTNLPFIQEVVSTSLITSKFIPTADVVIELGGEDAKIIFLKDKRELRMNGSCAGGTGAFIDQMATLLGIDTNDIDTLASKHTHIYEIASRCGVFAKTDLQQLLNQGATKEDLTASVLYAVVHQTVSGLAQGRIISGEIVYLGGPLTFLHSLRHAFDDILHVQGTCPDNSLYFAALGAAHYTNQDVKSHNIYSYKDVTMFINALKNSHNKYDSTLSPLFSCKKHYDEFIADHTQNKFSIKATYTKDSPYYLGIDAGSTTLKAILINDQKSILYKKYTINHGNPIKLVKEILEDIYETYPHIHIISSAVTGYGEELIKNAFQIDYGIVETIAHYTAALEYNPNVDFVLDIGGQDMKCFKIKDSHIDDIFLNEACSSGCGSFLSTFASSLGYELQEFINLGLYAKHPVDLGSRCTVFMNSAVKQAQKEGATIEDISAGLSISVIKNALCKVLRMSTKEDLGENIVVQGGTFLNDAILRAFEQYIGYQVIRPEISGLMGAYGASIIALNKYHEYHSKSTLLTLQQLKVFSHKVSFMNCSGCENHCHLTINTFSSGEKYIGGNRCNTPITGKKSETYTLYKYKRELLKNYNSFNKKLSSLSANIQCGTIGIPLCLNMYEYLPLWYTFFTTMGFSVEVSPMSTRGLYIKGQHTLPSDTVCYPAKLVHGHIRYLIEKKVDVIFYPCMNYALDERQGENCFNCPVVAFYPQVVENNIDFPNEITFLCHTLNLNNERLLKKNLYNMLKKTFPNIRKNEIVIALKAAFKEYTHYKESIHIKALEFQALAKKHHMPIIILAGRPYHIDNELNHGIDTLITSMGALVISEDVFVDSNKIIDTEILNQWTYQSRLLAAAHFVASCPKEANINLVHLVSFSCGTDAIMGDEMRRILEKSHKIYTQIKIDEISNLGVAKIRLKSLFATF